MRQILGIRLIDGIPVSTIHIRIVEFVFGLFPNVLKLVSTLLVRTRSIESLKRHITDASVFDIQFLDHASAGHIGIFHFRIGIQIGPVHATHFQFIAILLDVLHPKSGTALVWSHIIQFASVLAQHGIAQIGRIRSET